MVLTDHSIPIIPNRNDVPSTSLSDPNHPNGSFLTEKINNLITELQTKITTLEQSVDENSSSIEDLEDSGNTQTLSPNHFLKHIDIAFDDYGNEVVSPSDDSLLVEIRNFYNDNTIEVTDFKVADKTYQAEEYKETEYGFIGVYEDGTIDISVITDLAGAFTIKVSYENSSASIFGEFIVVVNVCQFAQDISSSSGGGGS